MNKEQIREQARIFERQWMAEHQVPFKYSEGVLYHKMADFYEYMKKQEEPKGEKIDACTACANRYNYANKCVHCVNKCLFEKEVNLTDKMVEAVKEAFKKIEVRRCSTCYYFHTCNLSGVGCVNYSLWQPKLK